MEVPSSTQVEPASADIDLAEAGVRLVLGGGGGGALLGGAWGIIVTMIAAPRFPGLAVWGIIVGLPIGLVLGLATQIVTVLTLVVQRRACRRTTRTSSRVVATLIPTAVALVVVAYYLTSLHGSLGRRAGAAALMTALVTALTWAVARCSLRHHAKPLLSSGTQRSRPRDGGSKRVTSCSTGAPAPPDIASGVVADQQVVPAVTVHPPAGTAVTSSFQPPWVKWRIELDEASVCFHPLRGAACPGWLL